MNWDRLEGNWKQFMGSAKAQWGNLTGDQWEVIQGKRDYRAGKAQERVGLVRDAMEKQIIDWQKRMKESRRIT